MKRFIYYSISAIIGIAGAALLFQIILMFMRDGFCDVNDQNGTACFRQWMGALSGWAGACAAAATIYVLYKQIAEQRRQTSFILGDELPSLDSVQDDKDPEKIVLRIVNWNRKSFKPEEISIPNTGQAIAMHNIDINGETVNGKLTYIDGWVDRSKSPRICTFTLKVADKTPHDTYQYLKEFSHGTEIIVTGVLLGERHRRTELRCFLHP